MAADKGDDTRDFVETLRREFNATPHVAQNNANRRSAIDGRTTRHPGYEASQKGRKRVEEPFGWGKESGVRRHPKLRGLQNLAGWFNLHAVADNRIRLRKLRAPAPA